MSDQAVLPVIIQMPGEIDVTNASDVLELITAACAPGVTVVVADLTATRFCDSTGLNHLIQAGHKAAAAGAELRLAISPDGTVSRVIELTGISRHLPVYLSTQHAAAAGGGPARLEAAPGHRAARPARHRGMPGSRPARLS